MFYLNDPSVVTPYFLLLLLKNVFHFNIPLTRAVSIVCSNVNEGISTLPPETTSSDIETGIIIAVGRIAYVSLFAIVYR